jgi:hypothetical protein
MNKAMIRGTLNIAIAAALFTIAGYTAILVVQSWRFWNATAARQSARPARASQSLLLDTDLYSSVLFSRDFAETESGRKRSLFLVVADKCPPCDTAIRGWSGALKFGHTDLAVEVAVPPEMLDATSAVRMLQASFATRPLRVRRIRNSQHFGYMTGINTAPTSVVLQRSTPIAVMLGPVSEGTISHSLQPAQGEGAAYLFSERSTLSQLLVATTK